jgi:hypothetical protein
MAGRLGTGVMGLRNEGMMNDGMILLPTQIPPANTSLPFQGGGQEGDGGPLTHPHPDPRRVK